MQLVLVRLDLAKGFDLDSPATLGSAAEVQAQIRNAFPSDSSIRFNDRGDGVLSAGGGSIRFSIAGADAVVEVGVEISGRRPDAFKKLEALCAATGWRLFDRASGRFLDLDQTDPTRPREAAAPMFLWWTALPAWIRVAIGLLIAWVLLYIQITQWVLSWH